MSAESALGGPVPVPAKASRPARARKSEVAAPAAPSEPAHRHPNLGKAPLDLTAGFPAAAAILRRDKAAIASEALETVAGHDVDFKARFDQLELARLALDGQVLIDKAATCVAADDPRPMSEYAEWIDPFFRRRRISLWDLAAVCAAIRDAAAPRLDEPAAASMTRTMNAAIAVLRKNGRLGGDGHKRDALLEWLYKGV